MFKNRQDLSCNICATSALPRPSSVSAVSRAAPIGRVFGLAMRGAILSTKVDPPGAGKRSDFNGQLTVGRLRPRSIKQCPTLRLGHSRRVLRSCDSADVLIVSSGTAGTLARRTRLICVGVPAVPVRNIHFWELSTRKGFEHCFSICPPSPEIDRSRGLLVLGNKNANLHGLAFCKVKPWWPGAESKNPGYPAPILILQQCRYSWVHTWVHQATKAVIVAIPTSSAIVENLIASLRVLCSPPRASVHSSVSPSGHTTPIASIPI